MLPKRRKKIRPLKSQVPPNESLARIQASTSSKNAARKLAVPAETDWAMVWQVFLAAIIASVCTILELFLWATYRNVPELTQEYLNQFLPWLHHYVIGHELDRELYLLGLLLFPTQLVIFVGCLHWANVRLKHGQEYLVTWMPGIMLGIIVWFVWLNSLVKWQYLLPRNTPFVQAVAWRCGWAVFLSLLFAVGWLVYLKLNSRGRRRLERATWIIVPLTLALIFFFQWFDEYKLFSVIYPHHFNSIFDANVQLYLGRPLLCRGLTHQYGLYPYFLEPLFRIIGLSVVSFSFIMQWLQVAVFGMIFWGLRRYLQHIGWAIATWLILVYFVYFQDFIHGQALDILYQYNPVRMLFPAILVCLLPRNEWVIGRKWWVSQILFGLAPFWNFDSGLIVWLAWQAAVGWQCMAEVGWQRVPQWLASIARFTSTGLLWIAMEGLLFCVYVKLRFGEWPNLADLLVFQSIFYKAGFAMLPMPLWHPWHVSLVVFGSGLAVAVYGLLSGRNSAWLRTTFGLSILGCGIFAAYNGRSHDLLFTYTTYGAILLAGAFFEQSTEWLMHRQDTRGRIAAWSIAGTWLSCFFYCMACMICLSPTIANWISKLHDPNQRLTLVNEERLLLEKWGKNHEELCILSFNRSGTFSLAAHRASPLEMPSLVETILVSQSQPMIDYLKSPGKKYLVIDLADSVVKHVPIIDSLLRDQNPKLIETSASRSMGLFEIGIEAPQPIEK